VDFPWASFVACIIVQTSVRQSWIIIGTAVALAFDIRTFRQVTFYMITAAGSGGIFFSLTLPLLIQYFSSHVLLVQSAISYGIILFSIGKLKPLEATNLRIETRTKALIPPFYYPLLACSLFVAIILVLLDYIYMVTLRTHFQGDSISIVSTIFSGGVFFLVLLFQIFVQKPFFLRFGILGGLVLFPMSVAFLAGIALFYPSLLTLLVACGLALTLFEGPYYATEETLLSTASSNLQNLLRAQFSLVSFLLGRAVIGPLILFLLGEEFATDRNVILITIVSAIFALFMWKPIKKGHHEALKGRVEQTRSSFLFQVKYSRVDVVADTKAIAFKALRTAKRESFHYLETNLEEESGKAIALFGALQLEPREHMRLELKSRYNIALERFLYLFAAVSDTRAVLNTMSKILGQIFAKSDESDRAFAIEYFDAISDNRALRSLVKATFESAPSQTVATYSDDLWLARVNLIETFIPGANMNMDEKILFLRRVKIFGSLPAEALRVIAESLLELTLQAGTELFHQRDEADRAYMVVSGVIEIKTDKAVIDEKSQFDLFGELAFLDNQPRSATAVAKTDIVLLCINKAEFNQLLEDIPDLCKAIVHHVMAYFRGKYLDHA
jgi:hypothetical protein